jgi:hypothetical protein
MPVINIEGNNGKIAFGLTFIISSILYMVLWPSTLNNRSGLFLDLVLFPVIFLVLGILYILSVDKSDTGFLIGGKSSEESSEDEDKKSEESSEDEDKKSEKSTGRAVLFYFFVIFFGAMIYFLYTNANNTYKAYKTIQTVKLNLKKKI